MCLPPGRTCGRSTPLQFRGASAPLHFVGSKHMLEDVLRNGPPSGSAPGQEPEPLVELPRPRRHKGPFPHQKWFDALLLWSESTDKLASRQDFTDASRVIDIWISLGMCYDIIDDIFCALTLDNDFPTEGERIALVASAECSLCRLTEAVSPVVARFGARASNTALRLGWIATPADDVPWSPPRLLRPKSVMPSDLSGADQLGFTICNYCMEAPRLLKQIVDAMRQAT